MGPLLLLLSTSYIDLACPSSSVNTGRLISPLSGKSSCCAEVHMMSGKVPAVSVVGGKGRGGFEPLPSGEPPALIAARKSREQKNAIIVKIGAVVVVVTAAVASLAAFLITRGDSSASLPAAPPDLFKSSRMMSDKISAV